MKESQYKGSLGGLCWEIISKKAIYGYELDPKSQRWDLIRLNAGTIYPLLQNRKTRNYSWGMRPSPDGPDQVFFTQ